MIQKFGVFILFFFKQFSHQIYQAILVRKMIQRGFRGDKRAAGAKAQNTFCRYFPVNNYTYDSKCFTDDLHKRFQCGKKPTLGLYSIMHWFKSRTNVFF